MPRRVLWSEDREVFVSTDKICHAYVEERQKGFFRKQYKYRVVVVMVSGEKVAYRGYKDLKEAKDSLEFIANAD